MKDKKRLNYSLKLTHDSGEVMIRDSKLVRARQHLQEFFIEYGVDYKSDRLPNEGSSRRWGNEKAIIETNFDLK